MNIEEVRDFCLSMNHATECLPFDDVTLVFKVGGKMFAMFSLDKPFSIFLKCDPEYALDLRDIHDGIRPAWHMNKKHWNQVSLQGDIGDDLLKNLIIHSYSLVFAKLTRKVRNELL